MLNILTIGCTLQVWSADNGQMELRQLFFVDVKAVSFFLFVFAVAVFSSFLYFFSISVY